MDNLKNTDQPLIYVQYPQPSGEKILKVLNEMVKEEKDYEIRHEVSFRGVYLKTIFERINRIR